MDNKKVTQKIIHREGMHYIAIKGLPNKYIVIPRPIDIFTNVKWAPDIILLEDMTEAMKENIVVRE